MNEIFKHKCSISENVYALKTMFLFKEMNNFLICDVNAKLNEKGIWCNPSRCDIEKAISNSTFDKIFKKKLKIHGSFLENIERGLKLKILNLIGLCKKAGLLEIGYDKVVKSLKNNDIDVILISKDDSKFCNVFVKMMGENKVLIDKTFSRLEIGKAIGYKNVTCIALIIGNLSETLKADLYKLIRFKI